jgi:hypothetical protein
MERICPCSMTNAVPGGEWRPNPMAGSGAPPIGINEWPRAALWLWLSRHSGERSIYETLAPKAAKTTA